MSKAFAFLFLVSMLPATGLTKTVTPLVVTGLPSEKTVINEIPLTGTVSSPRVADISAELSGLIRQFLVDEGTLLKTGDIILELDDEIQQLTVEAARAKTRQTRLELADAKRRLADARRLVKQKTISENDAQSLQAEVNIKAAAVELARAEQKQQEARLQRHKLSAPFEGVVSEKLSETGEWITPGDAVIRLVATQNLRIDFKVPQSAFPKISLNTPMRLRLETMPGKNIPGKIIAIVPVTDARARTFTIRVMADTQGLVMTPGMSANGVLQLDTGNKALTVSRDAILRYPDGRTTVWIVNEDQTVSEKPVETGLSFDGSIVILEGIEPGHRIILQGNESLTDGQKVSIQQE